MNINRKVLSMALGGAALPLGLVVANEDSPAPTPPSNTGRISDISPSNHAVLYDASYSTQDYAFETPSASYGSLSSSGANASCSCATGLCDSQECKNSSRIMGCGLGNMLGWGEVEALLWWAPNSQTPPLVATGALGQPATNVVLGGPDSPLGGEMLPGLRANFGFWLDDCQSIGAGGRVFGLFSPESSQTYASDGSTTLGVPYLDATQGIQTAYTVAFDTLGSGVDSGSITVNSATDFIAAEAYGRFLLARSSCSRADLIGGYSFVRLDDSIGVNTLSVDGISNQVPDGTIEETFDSFSTKNTFHGGHIGFTTDISRGRWTFSTLGKVALGNMNQQTTVSGLSIDTPPPTVGGSPSTSNIGLLARDSNIGSQQRDVFTFIPEAGAKLRYCLTPCMKFNVGYTFLFISDVALAGSMIDPILDLNQPQTIPTPQPLFEHGNYYLHGLDLGLSYEF